MGPQRRLPQQGADLPGAEQGQLRHLGIHAGNGLVDEVPALRQRNAVAARGGTVTVLPTGRRPQTFKITPEDSDVMRQVDLAELHQAGENNVTLQYDGDGSLLYQIAERHYLPWAADAPAAADTGPLAINVDYDKTTLAQDDTATVTVTIKNITDKIAEMPLIDVGVPPGFTVAAGRIWTAP